ncbi:hypothetical protein [Streptomyces sp. NPDC087300]|uniref:hypothetical protein n=1 Tax=Streptomyces sp. NPDC087300 TaxID=3365780 RepID=UPI0037F570E8
MALLKRVDWHDRELPYTQAELMFHEARVLRLRDEIAEIREAAEAMRNTEAGTPFFGEVVDFLEWNATRLERANEADGGVELDAYEDTREIRDEVPTEQRRALLMARAYLKEQR